MPTISENLAQLQQDREDLVDNLETMGITGLSGDETFTELVPEVLNIPAGADLSEYFRNTLDNNRLNYMIKTIPDNTTVSGTNLSYAFYTFNGLISIPLIDTTGVTDMSYMFSGCINLTTVPILNTASVTNFKSWFAYCRSLSNDSLNNILKMCANATGYNGTKTLYFIFGNSNMSSYYSASTIQSLSNYQDFLDAGWTIGWS